MRIKRESKRKIDLQKLYPALTNNRDGPIYGYINRKGKFILKPKYQNANDFNKFNIAIVQENNLTGAINPKGEYVIKPIYDNINSFKEGRATYILNGNMGVMDEKGNIMTNKPYNYVGDYKESRAMIGILNSTNSYTYGYIDRFGNEIIPPKFSQANDFIDGVVLVKIKDKKYALIDLYGNIINTYNYEIVSQYGNGLMVFSKSYGDKSGYINIKGQVVIKPIYSFAGGFKDGFAVVSTEDGYNGPYGVIDQNGNYIFQPIYSKIYYLGESRFALGMPIGEDKFTSPSIYAIGDTTGKQLSDFNYLAVGNYNKELAYGSDNEYTFFINKNGKIDNSLPIEKGSGELGLKDNIVYANIDFYPYYLSKSGKIIYKPNDTILLSKKYSVTKVKYSPNIDYLIYNPAVNGVSNKKVEKNINKKLIEISYFEPLFEENLKSPYIVSPDDVLNYNYFGDFSVQFFKNNLLTLDIFGYYYPLGAAHGMPVKKTPSIDLVTGKFYTLGDLFMGGVYWVGELNKIIKNMIETDPQYEYIFKDSFKSIKEDQPFYLDDENLYIYFPPYEIGPYAAGFVTFKIPFNQIEGMMNKGIYS
ncbi:hypothetical protein SH2C18_00540 [Clostridium sediminicola]|uniref:WG repeat-containing protein n=1 Tax=Clostridium sediminicola TaxID=3114879 RepID=UPI0031F1D95F